MMPNSLSKVPLCTVEMILTKPKQNKDYQSMFLCLEYVRKYYLNLQNFTFNSLCHLPLDHNYLGYQ